MPTEWYQSALTPPEVLEVNLRIGVIPSTDHVQVLVELKDPMTGILIAQRSTHHTDLRRMSGVVHAYMDTALGWLYDSSEPF